MRGEGKESGWSNLRIDSSRTDQGEGRQAGRQNVQASSTLRSFKQTIEHFHPSTISTQIYSTRFALFGPFLDTLSSSRGGEGEMMMGAPLCGSPPFPSSLLGH